MYKGIVQVLDHNKEEIHNVAYLKTGVARFVAHAQAQPIRSNIYTVHEDS